jgi:hypothetical protein
MSKESLAESIAKARRVSAKLHPSRKWQPLQRGTDQPSHTATLYHGRTSGAVEYWQNDLYEVTVRRYFDGWPFDPSATVREQLQPTPWVYMGICSRDGQARHDWRDLQRIKNDVCGSEWEAIELFPAESRLIDPSNYYILFAAPRIPIGQFGERQIAGPANTLAPQRPWPSGEEPSDSGKFLEQRQRL